MTTIDTGHAQNVSARGVTAGGGLATVAEWVTTADHKRIGRLFVGVGLVLLAGAVVVGGLLGFERIDPDTTTLPAAGVARMFTLYRVGLPYLAVAPLLVGLGIAVVPLQLGARSIAFGRTAALGLWAWIFGSALVVITYIGHGGIGGSDGKLVELFTAGFALALVGLLLAAVSLATTILTTRAPGMTLRRIPLFSWASLAGATAIIVSVPVLVADLVMLTVDRRAGANAGFGASADMLGWLYWALTVPAVLVLVVPSLGILADVAHTTTRRRLTTHAPILVGVGLFATAALSAVTQKVHVLPWSGDAGDKIADLLPWALFNLLPILGPLVVIGAVLAALGAAKPRHLPAALLFAVLGALLILLGTAANALTGIVDLDLLGTTYEEGTVVLVLGGAVLAALGGLVHWGPKLWGRTLPNGGLLPLALVGALGVAVAGVALLIAGFQGQPAMAYGGFDYDLSPQVLNTLVLVGHGLLLLCIAAVVILALKGFTRGPLAGDDPWDGATLEWATSSPPPGDNFVEVPRVASASPLLDLKPARSDA